MTSEDTQPEGDESVTPSTDTEGTTPAAPALNREQRRALAKGKKGTSTSFTQNSTPGFRPGASRPTNAPIQNRIPRTGHK